MGEAGLGVRTRAGSSPSISCTASIVRAPSRIQWKRYPPGQQSFSAGTAPGEAMTAPVPFTLMLARKFFCIWATAAAPNWAEASGLLLSRRRKQVPPAGVGEGGAGVGAPLE